MAQGVRKGFFYSSIGQVVSAVFIFLFQIILGRKLPAAEFGMLNIMYSLVSSFAVILNAGPRDVLIRNVSFYLAQNRKGHAGYVIKLSYIFYIIFSLIFILVFAILSKWTTYRFFDGHYLYLIIFLIGTILLAGFRITLSLSEAHREFHFFALINILFSLFLFLGMIVYLIIPEGFGLNGLMWTIGLSPLLPALICAIIGKNRGWFPASERFEIKGIYILFISLSIINFLDMFLFRSGSIVIKLYGKDVGNTIAGLFNYVFVPVSAIRTLMIALFASIFPNISNALGAGNFRQAKHYIKRGIQFVSVVSVSLTLFFYLTGPLLMKLLYKKTTGPGRMDFLLVSLFVSFLLMGRLGNRVLIALGKAKYTLIALLTGLTIIFLMPVLFKSSLLRGVEISLTTGTLIYSLIELIFILIFIKNLPSTGKEEPNNEQQIPED